MKTHSPPASKVTDDHLARLAYVYIRQSSLHQVVHNSESTELQYALVDRAARLLRGRAFGRHRPLLGRAPLG